MTSDKKVQIVDDNRVAGTLIERSSLVHKQSWKRRTLRKRWPAFRPIDIMALGMNTPGMNWLSLRMAIRGRLPDVEIGLIPANIQNVVRERVRKANIVFAPKPTTEERMMR